MKGEITNFYNEVDNETWSLIILSKKYGECVFLIDKEDLEKIKQHHWCVMKSQFKGCVDIYLYAITNSKIKNRLLHRFIMDATKGTTVDHADWDTFNTKKSNLRICNKSQNAYNSKTRITNKSGHPGVFWNTHLKTPKWVAFIMVNYKYLNLGYFDDYDEAVQVRENAEKKYCGEYK